MQPLDTCIIYGLNPGTCLWSVNTNATLDFLFPFAVGALLIIFFVFLPFWWGYNQAAMTKEVIAYKKMLAPIDKEKSLRCDCGVKMIVDADGWFVCPKHGRPE